VEKGVRAGFYDWISRALLCVWGEIIFARVRFIEEKEAHGVLDFHAAI